MVFIKGAWIELWPGDDRFHEYFCCPEYQQLCKSHLDENHRPQMWITLHCGLTHDEREIPFNEVDYAHGAIIRPDWCPLR